MKKDILKLIGLILGGLVIGWRELVSFQSKQTSTLIVEKFPLDEYPNYSMTGAVPEHIILTILILASLICFVLLDRHFSTRQKLSSPNSV